MTESDDKEERLEIGKRIIVFIGGEGSGKTTVAKRLAEESGKPYVTTGDIIRELAANDPGPLGDECRVMFATHSYLAGETLLRILVERFGREDTSEGFILDGGLRTLEETVDFQSMLAGAGRALPLTVIYLQLSDEESIRRLVTGQDARGRDDDTMEGVRARLAKFHFQLPERLEIIGGQPSWALIPVDATPDREMVYKEVREILSA